uniref:Uncharacterized protein n=1 Tax=Anguilla anguilla TaxID=7936 RepID=A0A0E9Q294_ANGAN
MPRVVSVRKCCCRSLFLSDFKCHVQYYCCFLFGNVRLKMQICAL